MITFLQFKNLNESQTPKKEFQRGDKVIVNGTRDEITFKNMIGKVMDSDYDDYCVCFDKKYENDINPYDKRPFAKDIFDPEIGWWVKKSTVIGYDDEPEEQNYEEWVEESNYDDFKVGDRVLIIDTIDQSDKYLIGLKGTIQTIEDETIILVKLDETPERYWEYQAIMDTNIFMAIDDELVKLDDEPEDSNMEEWVQESNEYNPSDFKPVKSEKELNLGDLVMVDNHGGYVNFGKVTCISKTSVGVTYFQEREIGGKMGMWSLRGVYRYKPEIENSDFEEWVQERYGN